MEDLSGIDQRKLVAESATEVCKECGGITFREVYNKKRYQLCIAVTGKEHYTQSLYTHVIIVEISPTICEPKL